MWLADARKLGNAGGCRVRRRERVFRAILVAACVIPLLGACSAGGFRPLYGSAGIGGAGANEKLAQVRVGSIPGRVGQRIRNELIFQSTGGGAQSEPAYQLEIAIRESVTSTLVRLDGDARGQVYNLDASFKLTRLSDNSVALQGKSYGRAGFERVSSIFANVRARQDAEDRAAQTVSEDLKSRLVAYLAGTA